MNKFEHIPQLLARLAHEFERYNNREDLRDTVQWEKENPNATEDRLRNLDPVESHIKLRNFLNQLGDNNNGKVS